jgi:hypothetical protein
MPSKIVRTRLEGMLDILRAAHQAGGGIANASIGRERELFIKNVLGNIISQPFRIGSGEIVDHDDNLAGQVDIVIEYANTLSFPIIEPNSERLYLAETVGAVVEVKSNLATQWQEVVSKAEAIAKLSRETGATEIVGRRPPPKAIPVFAVGYTGWKEPSTARQNLEELNKDGLKLCGILQISPCFYVTHADYPHGFDDYRALFGFLMSVEQITSSMIGSKPPFFKYVR